MEKHKAFGGLRIVGGTDYHGPGSVPVKIKAKMAKVRHSVPKLPARRMKSKSGGDRETREKEARALIYRHRLSDETTVHQALAWIAEGQFTEGYDPVTVVRFYKELRSISIHPFGADAERLGVYGAVYNSRKLVSCIPGLSEYKSVVTDDFDLLMG